VRIGVIRRQLPLILAVVWIAALCGVRSVLAGPPSGNQDFILGGTYPSIQNPVEQQSAKTNDECRVDPTGCVYNPTGCMWDIDDQGQGGAFGRLAAGVSTSHSWCMEADWTWRLVGVNVGASRSDLVVTVSYQPQGFSVQLSPRPGTAYTYDYTGCVIGPYYNQGDPQLTAVPESAGGVALQTVVTVTVTNPSARTARDTFADIQLGGSDATRKAAFCRGGTEDIPLAFGGAVWRTGL